ncbi:MAG: Phosphatidylglycerol lysyltransferase [Fibrobacteres bacterium]|nr:Phosphatidylglycerol lysyltransferase [Fibrobacterota bacterium]
MQADAERPSGDLAKARGLVLRYGWIATAYQILNPGIKLWFADGPEAVAGYADWGRVRVAAGAPICAPGDLPAAAAAFEADARSEGLGVCYFAAGSRLEGILGGSRGYARVLLGGQPVWDPASWPGILAGRPSLRAQLARARNKGVTVSEWPRERARESPALERCLKEWLSRRRMPAMHFLVEPRTLGRLWDRRVFVAEQGGEAIGFVMASPVPMRNGWLIEQIVRSRSAPNGTAELMVDAAFRAAAADGLSYFTLGLSPLSWFARDARAEGPWWMALLFRWLRLHGSRFYNFRGLDAFKSKFSPEEWEPIYAICNRPDFTPRILLAIAAAFGGVSPFLFTAMALAKAAKLEGYWMGLRFWRWLKGAEGKGKGRGKGSGSGGRERRPAG